MTDAFVLSKPENPLPLIFDSPHSGTLYPKDFDYACGFEILEKAEDKFVDDLFASASEHGAPFMAALFPRSYIDVNRCEKDIDEDLLEDLWPEESKPTVRSEAGIGLVRRLVRPGIPVYKRHLKAEEIKQRIQTYYRPYHTALGKLIDEAHHNYGQVWHINCHSMPSQSSFVSSLRRANPFKMPDFVLGDRAGTTCNPAFTRAVRDYLKNLGYSVAINDPYKGVELVERYSDPLRGRHSLQIEINKSLYMNEETCKKHRGYTALKADVDKLILFLADYTRSQLVPLAAD